jgi:hypothetical protein
LELYNALFTANEPTIVVPGEAFSFNTKQGATINIENPYDENLVNFIFITFSNIYPPDVLLPDDFLIARTNLSEKNVFHKLLEVIHSGFSIQLVLFSGRAENNYQITNKANAVFAFVISGAFEIQGRLLGRTRRIRALGHRKSRDRGTFRKCHTIAY